MPDLRTGVSAFGLAPLAGTSQSCGAALPLGVHSARIVPGFQQRAAPQPIRGSAAGTGSFLMTLPVLDAGTGRAVQSNF